MPQQGRITTWKDSQGYGFITPDSGGAEVFVHVRDVDNRARRPQGGERVSYALKTDARGRHQAVAVTFPGELASTKTRQRQPRTERRPLAVLFAIIFIALLIIATLIGKLPASLPLAYLAMSVITFVAYALDKSAAQRNAWRTPESTLHLLALVGGWPGALAAQRLLRHKSAKASFQIVFIATVLLNCGGVLWLMSAAGRRVLGAATGIP